MEEKGGLLPIMECQLPTGNHGRSAKVEKSSFLPNLKMYPLKLLINSKVKKIATIHRMEKLKKLRLEIKIHITN